MDARLPEGWVRHNSTHAVFKADGRTMPLSSFGVPEETRVARYGHNVSGRTTLNMGPHPGQPQAPQQQQQQHEHQQMMLTRPTNAAAMERRRARRRPTRNPNGVGRTRRHPAGGPRALVPAPVPAPSTPLPPAPMVPGPVAAADPVPIEAQSLSLPVAIAAAAAARLSVPSAGPLGWTPPDDPVDYPSLETTAPSPAVGEFPGNIVEFSFGTVDLRLFPSPVQEPEPEPEDLLQKFLNDDLFAGLE